MNHAIAIIPARGGSKRLPRKNILPLAGQPMLQYPVRAALASGVFDEVIVTTDDPEIADIARQAGASIWDRPPELATDQAKVDEVCAGIIAIMHKHNTAPDAFCCIYATAAFLQAEDFQRSAQRMQQAPAVDVVMGLSEFVMHPYKAMVEQDGYLTPLFPKETDAKSQTYPPMFASNGTFYWARTDYFREHPNFYAPRLAGYALPATRAVDIDTPDDYAYATRLAEEAFA